MSGVKLSWSERIVAEAAASPFKPINVGKAIRRTVWAVAVCVILVMAARELDGWLSLAMWLLLALRVFPFAFTGLLQRVVDERQARLDLLCPVDRQVVTSMNRMARHFGAPRPGTTTRPVIR